MAVVSGQYGQVAIGSSCVAEVDEWSIDKEAILHEFGTCTSPGDGGTDVLAGRRKHSCTFKGLLDATSGNEIEDYFEEGDTVTLKLYYTAQRYYTGQVVIGALTVGAVDIKDGAPVPWNASGMCKGLFTKASD